MTGFGVPIRGSAGKKTIVATARALADVKASAIAAATAAAAAQSAAKSNTFSLANATTDELQEGQYNLYFTDRRAEDAVGGILDNSANVKLTYTGGASIIADLTDLADAGGGVLQKTAFDAKGRKTGTSAATSDDLTEGSTNLYDAPVQAIALTDLSYPNVVALDGAGNAYYPDLTNPSDVSRIVGVTLHAAAMGAPVLITTSRDFTELAWSWSPGRIFCALTGGALTQTAPTTGAVVEVARVITPTTIRVGIQPATLR